jgi:hypothetical protein
MGDSIREDRKMLDSRKQGRGELEARDKIG